MRNLVNNLLNKNPEERLSDIKEILKLKFLKDESKRIKMQQKGINPMSKFDAFFRLYRNTIEPE